MSLFHINQKNEENNPANRQVIPIWKPDRSLPYVIHIPGYRRKDGLPFVCIRPEVTRYVETDMTYDMLTYVLNRDHGCKIKLIQKSESAIVFDDLDRHFSALGHVDNGPIIISVITEEEFEIEKRYYEKQGWEKLQTKGDLVREYIECLDD